MRPHQRPDFTFQIDPQEEIRSLEEHRQLPDRRIPRATDHNLLIATWNLTNFGLQQRESVHFRLMAEIMRPFDIIAIQEVADDVAHMYQLVSALGNGWDAIYTDVAGNQERLGYLYRTARVRPIGLAAELAMRGYERARIVIDGIDPEEDPFTGFNRNPYMVGFRAGTFEFSLVNVHLYWSNMAWRRLEAKALAKWARSRVNKAGPPNNDIILIGDFNMPQTHPDDPIFSELAAYGLSIPKHATDIMGTNLAGDMHYDEIAFFPSRTHEDFSGRMGVFDFDNAIFHRLWNFDHSDRRRRFFQYLRYYIADHRVLWAEFMR